MTQFKKGEIRHRPGRPKKTQDIAVLWNAILGQLITITEGGRSRRVTKREALLTQVVNGGLSKDYKAVNAGIAVLRLTGMIGPDPTDDRGRPLRDDDLALIQDYLSRLGKESAEVEEIEVDQTKRNNK
jgi:hypothetical protein